ncbi:MAG: hypothetical protein Q4C85_00905 [Actinomyces sp.]|uniref:hypothetical protein n=1 Tax=Actinomyces sp. TaxID=29317 RepID=UPI0026DBF0C1|nr:hypothetical protein [Actinomyces sp.]MDO4242322.1 hypothetical protein [Actinomyces sp.]
MRTSWSTASSSAAVKWATMRTASSWAPVALTAVVSTRPQRIGPSEVSAIPETAWSLRISSIRLRSWARDVPTSSRELST